ncbi:hypothetical protein DGo_PE0024 (plasmid) [Deinococcus gobiensis I-0]|uniref:Uncharacterized protein n=1 Tax=Deinococcus gobiensis (strain DSM 21396 / JCM 16679 / CGMCC 1.7299 / I-0) TaxID=745776 RepID=H8H3S1_DEIGI|nr:hypothetical protein DGo_PE0024 [Deinococcus gobiensis I-0]
MFPTGVGMDRDDHGQLPGDERVPHRRGDGPLKEAEGLTRD